MAVRRVLAVLIFAGLVFTSIDVRNLAVIFTDRRQLHQRLTILPDRGGWWPDFPAFLDDVRAHTRPGDTIALVVPTRDPQTYTYAYYRASYLLAGRDVCPVMTREGRLDAVSFRRARYVAAWKVQVAPSQHVVLRSHSGALVAR